MSRVMELICEILRYAESAPTLAGRAVPEIDGYDTDQVHYHVHLCEQAGYLEASKPIAVSGGGLRYARLGRLTWQGHDALERLCR